MLNDAHLNEFGSKGRCRRRFWKVLAIATMVAGGMSSTLLAPVAAIAADPQTSSAPMPQEKLDSLLAPIALYPDQLLTQALMASTYPLDVVAAARFVEENKDLKGEALDKAIVGKNWDPSVQSLAAYPQVLLMMNNKLDWTQELGEAFLSDEKRVMATVQSLRRKAYDAGNLKSNEQQKVIEKETVIIVEPATEVVYVPSYNPTVVYATTWPPAYPPYYYPPPPAYYPGYSGGTVAMAGLIGFGLGVAMSDNHWGWSDCDWGGGDVDVNVNRNNTFVNNNQQFKNKVNNGKWNHNPAQRKGVGYNNPRTREQFRKSDPGAVSSRRDARGHESRDGRDGRDSARRNDTGRDTARDTGRDAGRDTGRDTGRDNAQRQRDQSGLSDRGQRSERSGARDDRSSRTASRDRSSGAQQPSFDSRQSRQQTRDASSRGASSRSQMGGGRAGGGGGGRSGGGRGGGGGGRR